MSKRGLSRQEKKDIIVKLLRDTKEPYAMPDLENKAATLGVVKQTVKEIVLEIASEGLCETDKIGPTAFYWAFPSAAFNKVRRNFHCFLPVDNCGAGCLERVCGNT